MRITQYQSNFTVGELDPLLKSRTDLDQYNNALEEALNVIMQPQGGFSRRPGLQFIHNFGATFTEFKLIAFEFSVDDSYLLVFVAGRIYVFKAGILQTNINGSGNDYITATDITAAMLDELNYTQAVDTLILCHEDLQTKRLLRNSDTSWTLENLPLTNLPKYAYDLDAHMPNFTITPSATSGNITITASAVTTDTGTAQAGGSNTITLKAASSYTSDDDPNGMFIEITSGTGSGQKRHVEDYVASTKVLTVYPAWDTQPDNTSQYAVRAFNDAAVGEYAQVSSTFGRARYIEFITDTQMKAVVEVPFFDTSAVIAGNWESEHGYEDTWSSTRGWPRSATFHEGRLYFGGSKTRPNTIWGSRVIDYFNFDAGTGLDDESVEATINTNQLNAIVNMQSGADLRIFTTGGEFVVVQGTDEPITPSYFLIRPQTRSGSKPGVPIEDLNGASVFVQRQGKSLNAFQFGSTAGSYQLTPLSILSSHLIKNPVDLAARRSTSTDEADRLFLVNGDDGSITCYSILVGQDVISPSKFTTDGDFKAVAVEQTDTYTIVKSPIINWGSVLSGVGLSKAIDTLANDWANYGPGGVLNVGVYAWLTENVDTGNGSYPRADLGDNGVVGTLDAAWWDAYGLAGFTPVYILQYIDYFFISGITYDAGSYAANQYIYDRMAKFMIDFFAGYEAYLDGDANFSWIENYVAFDYILQKFNPNLNMDRAINGGSGVNFATNSILRDRAVEIIADGIYIGQKSADSQGKVVFGAANTTDSYQVGLDYTVRAKTMPAEPVLASGSVQSFKKRIVQVDAIINSTQNMKINGKSINFDDGDASTAIVEYTGKKTVHGLLGYSDSAQITITQDSPLKMTVLGLDYKVSVGN